MRELEGRSYQEIADVLGLSTSAVETLIFRARRALREQLEGSLTCTEAELAISRQLDGRLGRKEKGQLRAHLRECEDCARFARSQRAQRSAIQSLALIPVPSSLSSFFGQHAAATGAGAGAAAAGTGVAAKVALVGASAIVATGVGVETAHKAGWHPLRHSHRALAAHVAKPTPPPSASSARSGAVADGAAVLPPALARGQTRAQKPTHVGGPSDVPAPPHVAKGPKGTPPGLARKIPKIVSSHGRAPAVARARHSARPSKPVASSHRSTATRHRAAPAHRPHGSPAVKLNPPPPHKHGSTATILNPPAPPDDSGSHGHQK
jgi:hypothetical protein